MSLHVDDGTSVAFYGGTAANAGEAFGSTLETEFAIETTQTGLSRTAEAIAGGIGGTIDAAEGAAEA